MANSQPSKGLRNDFSLPQEIDNQSITPEMIDRALNTGEIIFDVALSFAGEDRNFVASVAEHLTQNHLRVFYDKNEAIQTCLWGKDLGDTLDKVYRHLSSYVIVFISRDYANKMWTEHERKSALSRAIQVKREYVLPARFDDTELDGLLPTVGYIDLREKTPQSLASIIARKVAHLNHITLEKKLSDKEPTHDPSQGPRKRPKLSERISEEQWQLFEQAAIHAVTAGGMAAMGFYRQALQWPNELLKQSMEEKNPSTIADLQATSAILQAIDSYLSPISRKLGSSLLFLGEETEYQDWLESNLSQNTFQCIQLPEDFFADEDNSIRVILDGVDGTGNFIRGMPLFCSAVAIIISNQVRVSAIYDPIHHVVYSALLTGPYSSPNKQKKACSWQISTGNRTNLIELAKCAKRKGLDREAIGIHLTRSNPEKLHEFLSSQGLSSVSMLERIANASGAVYAINSGIVAMTNIAEGGLGGFINNVTNLWDVAAGEVLIRACGGKVTDFNGDPIDYSYFHKVSLVTAKEYIHPDILEIVNHH